MTEFRRTRDLDHEGDASARRHASYPPPVSRAGMPRRSLASFLSVESQSRSLGVSPSARALGRALVAVAAAVILPLLLSAEVRGRVDPAAPPVPPAMPGPASTPVPTGTLRVSVALIDTRGQSQPAADAVVWIEGDRIGTPPASGHVAAKVAQQRKTFEPHIGVVRVGSTVAFPNLDRIYHNVFSLSEIAPFDLGLYRNGASRSLVFTRPGVVRIYCNIHPDMAAFLVVVNSDAFGKTAANGSLELRDVPIGRWPVSAWHEKGGEGGAQVTVEAGRTTRLDIRLDASRWRPAQHKNKYGKDYPPPDDDENRY